MFAEALRADPRGIDAYPSNTVREIECTARLPGVRIVERTQAYFFSRRPENQKLQTDNAPRIAKASPTSVRSSR